jgi:hypothetical protein
VQWDNIVPIYVVKIHPVVVEESVMWQITVELNRLYVAAVAEVLLMLETLVALVLLLQENYH